MLRHTAKGPDPSIQDVNGRNKRPSKYKEIEPTSAADLKQYLQKRYPGISDQVLCCPVQKLPPARVWPQLTVDIEVEVALAGSSPCTTHAPNSAWTPQRQCPVGLSLLLVAQLCNHPVMPSMACELQTQAPWTTPDTWASLPHPCCCSVQARRHVGPGDCVLVAFINREDVWVQLEEADDDLGGATAGMTIRKVARSGM